MLRPEHNSGLRIAFPQVRADLLFLALTTLAAIALALILSEPARENVEIAVSRFHALSNTLCPIPTGDKSKLRNSITELLGLDCLKSDLAVLGRDSLTGATGLSAQIGSAPKPVRLRGRGVASCIGISFLMLLLVGQRFLRISLLGPVRRLEEKAQHLQELVALSEQRATEMFAAVPCGLMVLRSDLTVLSVNRACREMFRLPAAEMRPARLES